MEKRKNQIENSMENMWRICGEQHGELEKRKRMKQNKIEQNKNKRKE